MSRSNKLVLEQHFFHGGAHWLKMMYHWLSQVEPAVFKVNDSERYKGNLITAVPGTEPSYCTHILSSSKFQTWGIVGTSVGLYS